jgi:hypothetical protein
MQLTQRHFLHFRNGAMVHRVLKRPIDAFLLLKPLFRN